mmetsp:Transcript_5891/g.11665  ORF Transcript_5891/g.11665 Transcript_5891/m.11665 type:complete len:488 (+) Transcript_5891:51-1514(+)|eukprot:CAMPEP_0181332454 /NCGR_PEP_ID=MMETSP1101-20121128/25110_1 /TAXON_ID=46948 /ORGANISM="Rhodomonas abbreviata, Strain Caron Lab Isolate" /LENGTH=487 /DNA_ID=CAMNT_0023442115 /DNA_START=51 /DNA_END=1514 /DNA_ORIENTATION=-
MLQPRWIVALSSFVLCSALASGPADSDLKTRWKQVVTATETAEWGVGKLHERRGQICDPWREIGKPLPADKGKGCTVVFIADPHDVFTVADLPLDQQDNFQNTQHYEEAWNIHGSGFLGDSLPRAPQDIDPVCYIVNSSSGVLALGYEEGNGDKLLPCPGHRRAAPFTEADLLSADADLEDMCNQCYHSVCTGSVRAQDCGNSGTGGVDVGEGDAAVTLVEQVNPAYHCHLTMADEGACDYVQYDQHEESREYHMEYAVLCGWQNIRDLNIIYCDCTAEAGTANNCQRDHCLEMAYEGVVCGNCNGCSQSRAYDSIFIPPNAEDRFDGSCGAVRSGATEAVRNESRMMCSKGLNCPVYNGREGCLFHCSLFDSNSETWTDPECPNPACSDGVQNQDEADVDCGGICGETCTAPFGYDYRGCTSQTVSGRECQRWDAQEPHAHNRTPQNYPHAGLVNNYCRNPDGESGGPWCYTTDASQRWEYCDVGC